MAKQWFCMVLCAAGIASAVSARGVSEGKVGSAEPDLSYAFGVFIGSQFQDSGLEFDYMHVAVGIRDAMEDKAAISDEEAFNIFQAAYQAAYFEAVELARVQEEAYLAENAARSGVHTTESGLQYEVIIEGTGEKAQAGDVVEVNYESYLTDGTLFDSSYLYGESAKFYLGNIIPGFSEGLQLMSEGSTYKLYIPSSLAFGIGNESFPPYSTLILTIELLSIKTETEEYLTEEYLETPSD